MTACELDAPVDGLQCKNSVDDVCSQGMLGCGPATQGVCLLAPVLDRTNLGYACGRLTSRLSVYLPCKPPYSFPFFLF